VFSTSTRSKKNGTIEVADLALQLVHEQIDQLKACATLPEDAEYLFDELRQPEDGVGIAGTGATTVQKTRRRRIVTLKYGVFQACEVVRTCRTPNGACGTIGSQELSRLVGRGCMYGYDVVAHVGVQSFLRGRRLEEIHHHLREAQPALDIPLSTLDELRRRFLFHLGCVQKMAASRLKETLREEAGMTWLIDGTLEPGTPVFFGVQHAASAILLGCWKIPTENTEDIAPCLTQTAHDYGRPDRILHDLSSVMSRACNAALAGVPHDVCHFHFARDVGDDLLTKPQNALSARLRSLKLQVRMREQRKTQTEWLREHAGQPEAALILQRLLTGAAHEGVWNETLGKEVLLALHFWIMDYAADGGRQGFPFDPHFLYLHRRLLRGHDALERLFARPAVAALVPRPLWNLRQELRRYRDDDAVVAAAAHFELAFHEFDRLRNALRLTPTGDSPMHHGYELDAEDWQQVCDDLDALAAEYRQRIESSPDGPERDVCHTILTHIDKYSPQLVSSLGAENRTRTTNHIEGHWSASKRACRQTQGRRKLTRTFHALPSELMLIPNLLKEQYLTTVLDGSLDNLPAKFAEADTSPHAYAAWRRSNTSLNLGRLPARILRQSDFVENLIDLYDEKCRQRNEIA
jgi:hypothetical protein